MTNIGSRLNTPGFTDVVTDVGLPSSGIGPIPLEGTKVAAVPFLKGIAAGAGIGLAAKVLVGATLAGAGAAAYYNGLNPINQARLVSSVVGPLTGFLNGLITSGEKSPGQVANMLAAVAGAGSNTANAALKVHLTPAQFERLQNTIKGALPNDAQRAMQEGQAAQSKDRVFANQSLEILNDIKRNPAPSQTQTPETPPVTIRAPISSAPPQIVRPPIDYSPPKPPTAAEIKRAQQAEADRRFEAGKQSVETQTNGTLTALSDAKTEEVDPARVAALQSAFKTRNRAATAALEGGNRDARFYAAIESDPIEGRRGTGTIVSGTIDQMRKFINHAANWDGLAKGTFASIAKQNGLTDAFNVVLPAPGWKISNPNETPGQLTPQQQKVWDSANAEKGATLSGGRRRTGPLNIPQQRAVSNSDELKAKEPGLWDRVKERVEDLIDGGKVSEDNADKAKDQLAGRIGGILSHSKKTDAQKETQIDYLLENWKPQAPKPPKKPLLNTKNLALGATAFSVGGYFLLNHLTKGDGVAGASVEVTPPDNKAFDTVASVIRPAGTPDVAIGGQNAASVLPVVPTGEARNGQVVKIFVKPGDKVKAGDALYEMGVPERTAQLEAAEKLVAGAVSKVESAQALMRQQNADLGRNLVSARAELRRAQTNLASLSDEVTNAGIGVVGARQNLDAAQRELTRYAGLQGQGAVSRQLLDQKQDAVNRATTALQSAKANFTSSQQRLAAEQESLVPIQNSIEQIQVDRARLAKASAVNVQSITPEQLKNLRITNPDLANAAQDLGKALIALETAQKVKASFIVRAPVDMEILTVGRIGATPEMLAGTDFGDGLTIDNAVKTGNPSAGGGTFTGRPINIDAELRVATLSKGAVEAARARAERGERGFVEDGRGNVFSSKLNLTADEGTATTGGLIRGTDVRNAQGQPVTEPVGGLLSFYLAKPNSVADRNTSQVTLTPEGAPLLAPNALPRQTTAVSFAIPVKTPEGPKGTLKVEFNATRDASGKFVPGAEGQGAFTNAKAILEVNGKTQAVNIDVSGFALLPTGKIDPSGLVKGGGADTGASLRLAVTAQMDKNSGSFKFSFNVLPGADAGIAAAAPNNQAIVNLQIATTGDGGLAVSGPKDITFAQPDIFKNTPRLESGKP